VGRKLWATTFISKARSFQKLSQKTFRDCLLAVAMSPLALVYQGPGSCIETPSDQGCSESAARMARLAGFRVEMFNQNGPTTTQLATAKVWIQPGGRARLQAEALGRGVREQARRFVSQGGGYVGFCAGAFLATETFGWEGYQNKGFGFLPGKSEYDEVLDAKLLGTSSAMTVLLQGLNGARHMYWELGPYFLKQSLKKGAEAIAWHFEGPTKTPRIVSLRSRFGKGRVFVTGFHPEAPQSWYDSYHIQDPDGTDEAIAVQMIEWSSGSSL
jgi:glutamine amidotransferase-like uncharacterized protein